MKNKKYNIELNSIEFREKLKLDLSASAVVFKEKNNIPVDINLEVMNYPENVRKYFIERVKFYRKL